MSRIAIDPQRLLADLQTLRGFGRCGNGVVRPAFSEADAESRRWLAGRMREAGLEPHLDPAGNLFGLPPGDAPAILIGSHSDTQPEGGWLDGAYGVIAGLEVARASREAGGPPVAVVSFQDEEGRYGVLIGSQLWSGSMGLEAADPLTDRSGATFGELRAVDIGLPRGDFPPAARFSAYLEPHIEQGPVLDRHGESIGVVEAIVGIRETSITLVGEQNHAGTTPMALRRDAFRGLTAFAQRLDEAFESLVTPATVWTIGQVALHPDASSIVPGRVRFSLQWRDADEVRLQAMERVIHETVAGVAADLGLSVTVDPCQALAPVEMDPGLAGRLAVAAERHAPGRWRRMVSGALHDATNVSRRVPAAMLFVPSIGGISHSFDEATDRDDLVLGVRVLASCVDGLAGSGCDHLMPMV